MGWIFAVLTGVLSGLSFPAVFAGWRLPNLGFLAFFAWVPLFYVLRDVSPRRAFLLSMLAGFIQYIISMYWLYTALNTFGHLSVALSIVVLCLLILILSAYLGVIFYLSQWISNRTGWPVGAIRPWVWVGIEFLRGHIPAGGFPWGQLGYSQGGFLPFIQVADLFGVYFVTFLIVLVNEGITSLLWQWKRREVASRTRILFLFTALFFAGDLAYGAWRMNQPAPPAELNPLVGIVQGNIPQDEKWLASAAAKILKTYQEGSAQVEVRGAELVIWPEAAFPVALPLDHKDIPISLGTERADILFGAITRPSVSSELETEAIYYNSALLVDAEGHIQETYHKRHLVPFGEYIPWKKFLFFARKMTTQVGNVAPGESYYPLHFKGREFGVLICYEDIFPEIARSMVKERAHALINLTNDAWYGVSSAPYQHQVFSQFRSIETRRALVRATNTGVSSMIDRWGRILWEGHLFEREDFLTRLPFYSGSTLYVELGDVFPIVCLGWTAVALLWAWWIAKKSKKGLSHV